MARPSNREHAAIRIRAARSRPHARGEEAPLIRLTTAEKAELGRLAQIIDFRTAGSEIFSQGDEATFLYLLIDGVVRSLYTLPNGERQILAFHWPGDLFGLAENGKYVNSAQTVTTSRVYRFLGTRLEHFLLKNPNVQDGFLVKAVHDLRSAQRQLIVMGRLDVQRRLAAFLIDCSAHEHYFDRNTQVLTLPMSRYDIADYLGTSAETVTRAMTRFEKEGLLHRDTARTLTLDSSRLKAFAGLN